MIKRIYTFGTTIGGSGEAEDGRDTISRICKVRNELPAGSLFFPIFTAK